MDKTSVRMVLSVALAAAVLSAGCGGPVVTVEHVLPADLALPAGPCTWKVGPCAVAEGPADGFARYLADRLSGKAALLTTRADGWGDVPPLILTVNGTIHIAVQDVKGTRMIRGREATATAPAAREVDSLVRTVRVRVDFVVAWAAAPGNRVAAETRQTYTSLADPRVRGPLGLRRADDPAGVPAVETIVNELLAECAKAFGRMVTPPLVTAQVRLRARPAGAMAKALAAAEAGSRQAARTHAQAARDAAPARTDLIFDQAAIEEMTGDLDAALAHYRQFAAKTQGGDAPTREAIARVGRVLARRTATKANPVQPE